MVQVTAKYLSVVYSRAHTQCFPFFLKCFGSSKSEGGLGVGGYTKVGRGCCSEPQDTLIHPQTHNALNLNAFFFPSSTKYLVKLRPEALEELCGGPQEDGVRGNRHRSKRDTDKRKVKAIYFDKHKLRDLIVENKDVIESVSRKCSWGYE